MANLSQSSGSSKALILLAMVSLFGVCLFLKPGLYEYDSYHFLSVACNPEWKDSSVPFSEYLYLEWLPCAEWAFKLWSIACFALFLLIAKRIGDFFDPVHGWLFALTLFFGNSLIGLLARTENDNLGYLFVICSFYLFLSWKLRNKTQDLFYGIFLIFIGGFIWKGVWLWGAVLGLMTIWPIGLLVGLIGFWEVWRSTSLTAEQGFGIGLFSTVFYWLFLPNQPRFLWLATIYTALLTLVSIKYSLFLILLLNVALFTFFKQQNFFEGQKTPIGPKKDVFMGFAAVFFIVACLSIISGQPTGQQLEQNQLAVTLANGQTISNDFENGHLITYFGGNPAKRFGPPNPDMNGPGIKLTRQNLNCEYLVLQVKVQDYNSNLYECAK